MRRFFLVLFMVSLIGAGLAMEPHTTESMSAEVAFQREITSDFLVTEANFLTYEFPVGTVREGSGYEKLEDEFGNTYLKMEWVDTQDMSYLIEFEVETHAPKLLESSPEFPTKYDGLDEYLAPGIYTPVTSSIRKKANEIVHGSDTVFEAAARLALWVNENIEYDTSLGGTIEDSAETFEVRKGTCDEFSHLFISMARSVGIPARYVSGVTYGSFGIEGGGALDWYSHGWTEVYIGEWVAFDPTYGEIGYVDGTHIKIAHAPDQKDLESYMTWRPDSSTVDLNIWEHSIKVLGSKDYPIPLQQVSMRLVPERIGIGEYALAKIISTPRGCNGQGLKFIYSDSQADTADLHLVMGETVMTSIGCSEAIEHYQILRSPMGLDDSYSYQFEVLAYNNQEESRKRLEVTPRMEGPPSIELSLDTLSISPGDILTVRATVESEEDVGVFLFKDGELVTEESAKAGASEFEWVIKDGAPGLHNIYLYVPRALATASYSVEDAGPLSVKISGPGTIEPGNRTWFDVEVDGELYTEANVIFDLFTSQSQVVSLSGVGSEKVSFIVDVPETAQGKVYATAQVVSPGSSANAVKELAVYQSPIVGAEKTKTMFAQFMSRLVDNFKYLMRQLKRKF